MKDNNQKKQGELRQLVISNFLVQKKQENEIFVPIDVVRESKPKVQKRGRPRKYPISDNKEKEAHQVEEINPEIRMEEEQQRDSEAKRG